MKKDDSEIEVCKCTTLHEDTINHVKENLIKDESLYDLAEFFKVLGDPTRIKIISALVTAEMCVCDIAFLLNMTQSAISHQLKILRQTKLVKFRKEGKVVYYSLDDEHVKEIVDLGFVHINEK